MNMLIIEKIASSVLAPFKVVRRTLSGRFARSLRFQRADRLRPSKKFSVPILEYGQLSALYFAIEQAIQDDEVRNRAQSLQTCSCCVPSTYQNHHIRNFWATVLSPTPSSTDKMVYFMADMRARCAVKQHICTN
jgi:hypothetical protein